MLEVELPAGDLTIVKSSKPVMVLQHTARHCIDTGERPSPSSTATVNVMPSLKETTNKYILSPLSQDKDTIVTINMVMKGKRIDKVFLNNISLSSQSNNVLNITLYGSSGQFRLYRLKLLATSGKMECQTGGFLIFSQTNPFIHIQPNMENNNTSGVKSTSWGDSLSNGSTVEINGTQFISNIHSRISTHDRLIILTTPSIISKSPIYDLSRPVVTLSSDDPEYSSSSSSTINRKLNRKHPKNHLNDILKHGSSQVTDTYGPSSNIQASDIPFVVKEDKSRHDINFHETEADNIWFVHRGDGSSLDITVIAVILSLASAVILVIVVIFGFLMAERWCRRDRLTISKLLLSLRRISYNRRKIEDSRPLIQDNFEMLEEDYDVEVSP